MLYGAFWFFVVIFFFGALVLKTNMPPPLKSRVFWCFFVIGIGLGGCQSAIKHQKARLSVLFGAFWCFLVVLMRLRGRQSCSSPPFNIRAFWCFFVIGIGFCGRHSNKKHDSSCFLVLFSDSSLLVALTPPGVYNLVVCLEVTLRHCPERFH